METPTEDKSVADGNTHDVVDDDVMYKHQVQESSRQ